MTKHFCLDVETCSTESNAIVLSVAVVWFDPTDAGVTYEQLVDRCLYVKFDAREQKKLGRHVSKDTMEWWNKQSEAIKNLAFLPSSRDVTAAVGLEQVRAYIKEHGNEDSFIWARGSLDSMVVDSLARSVDLPPLTNYSMWMDVRTAIRVMKETTNRGGYCPVEGLDMGKLLKHCPIDDVCIDVLMLVKGE